MKFISSEREDDLPSFMEPQASLPSAAQPAVMDIRRLRRRLLEINVHRKIESSAKEKNYCLVRGDKKQVCQKKDDTPVFKDYFCFMLL